MRKTHIIFPVSYVSDDGQTTIHACWAHRPTGIGYWVGHPIEVVVDHPDGLSEEYRAAEIAKLESRIATLKEVTA